MPLKDWLDKYEHKAEDFDFDTFKADLLKEFSEDEGVWTAKVNETEESLSKTANDLKETKARNWDLLQKVPTDNKTTPEVEQPKELTIDDFFGEKQKADA